MSLAQIGKRPSKILSLFDVNLDSKMFGNVSDTTVRDQKVLEKKLSYPIFYLLGTPLETKP
jgi:hypothetical protein